MIDGIQVIIPCVDYSDMLLLSLPFTRRVFSNILVVSCPGDDATASLCCEMGVECIQTQVWFSKGTRLNKAGALNEALASILAKLPETWVLSLDADIILPAELRIDTSRMDEHCLYSLRRRYCPDESLWEDYLAGVITIIDFPVERFKIKNGAVWNSVRTSNPNGLCGYFQLWNPKATGIERFPDAPSASGYDVEFALKFREEHRLLLESTEVIHLGEQERNWNGRISPLWRNLPRNARIPASANYILKQLEDNGVIECVEYESSSFENSRYQTHFFGCNLGRLRLKTYLEHDRKISRLEEFAVSEFARFVRTPEVVATSSTSEYKGLPFVLLCQIGGSPLRRTDALGYEVKREIERYLFCHERGSLGQAVDKDLLKRDTYQRLVSSSIQEIRTMQKKFSYFCRDLRLLSKDLLAVLATYVNKIPLERKVSLQHGNFTPKNILMDSNGDIGLSDFDRVRFGDHYLDLYCYSYEVLEISGVEAANVFRFLSYFESLGDCSLNAAVWNFWRIQRWFDWADDLLERALPQEKGKSRLTSSILENGEVILNQSSSKWFETLRMTGMADMSVVKKRDFRE